MKGSSENEAERRSKIAEEKLAGYMIELIERMRKRPIADSITFRLYYLYESIRQFQKVVKAMGKNVDPIKTIAPSFTKEQANFLIRTYNHIIKDIHLHFGKKDSYVRSFPTLSELETPTLDDVTKILFTMGTNLAQIMSYMIRWV
jgi:ribosomal protein S17E